MPCAWRNPGGKRCGLVHGIIMLCHAQQKKLRHAHGAYTVRKTYRMPEIMFLNP